MQFLFRLVFISRLDASKARFAYTEFFTLSRAAHANIDVNASHQEQANEKCSIFFKLETPFNSIDICMCCTPDG